MRCTIQAPKIRTAKRCTFRLPFTKTIAWSKGQRRDPPLPRRSRIRSSTQPFPMAPRRTSDSATLVLPRRATPRDRAPTR